MVPAAETSAGVLELNNYWERIAVQRWGHPLIALAGYKLDFLRGSGASLSVHPFRDGNGCVSRLLWRLQLYQSGYKVGRYISIDRIIIENGGDDGT